MEMDYLRKPSWIRVRLPAGQEYGMVNAVMRKHKLHTVCEEALCPNISECWRHLNATIMILGDTCTRSCRFCAVKSGKPGGIVDLEEPKRVAEAIQELGLRYVVITSVTRDDLEDGGASIYAETVREIRKRSKNTLIELLIPDFNNNVKALEIVVDSKPDVIGHNIETVKRLTPLVRDARAGYEKSLKTLKTIKELNPEIYTKSSIMLGLGETVEEVVQSMIDLRKVGVDFLTLGQYLRPTKRHLPVKEYIPPERFEELRRIGENLGFLYVASGPLVRSSYLAGEFYLRALIEKHV
ncbi:MAG: lipoyl synthase [Thaumarchaeota archaeon]|nr:lipoyl synthase [Candidatus Geocrenenecus arthurdayi]MCL7403703.1 lipoyl synthase [Candidatus Geocrenenecus arthurdayi]